MAISFPSNPSNGDKFESNSMLYQYDGTNSLWIRLNRKDVSHYTDTTNLLPAQTLQVVNVPDLASLPGSASAGQMMYVLSENKLYLWTGSTWQIMTLAKQNPVLTSTTDGSGGTSPFTLATDGSTTVITMTASHPDSLPLIYNYNVVAGSLTNGGGTTATITQGTGAQSNQFFIQPSTDAAYNGSFTVEFTVSDGEATEVSVGEFALAISNTAWNGDRGFVMMEASGSIDYINITSPGSAAGFGNLVSYSNSTRRQGMMISNGSNIFYCGGRNYTTGSFARTNAIESFVSATPGNATSFGTLTIERNNAGGSSDGIYGVCFAGGTDSASYGNIIDYFTMATAGGATAFGNSTAAASIFKGTVSDGTYGVFAEGQMWSPNQNKIEYITIASPGSSTNFGQLSVSQTNGGCHSDTTRGVFMGGNANGSNTSLNVIDYITIATPGTATDFGDLIGNRHDNASCGNETYACATGGYSTQSGGTLSTIEYITIQNASPIASSFGNLTSTTYQTPAASGFVS